MPFDNANIPADRVTLMNSVISIVKVFDKAGLASDKASEAKAGACDEILVSFRAALKDCDIVPFLFWQDVCNEAGYAHTRLDMATGKATKIEGAKPHNTLRNVATQIKKYYENNSDLDIGTYTELRKENAPTPSSDFDKAVKAVNKLSREEMAIMIESIQKALESV